MNRRAEQGTAPSLSVVAGASVVAGRPSRVRAAGLVVVVGAAALWTAADFARWRGAGWSTLLLLVVLAIAFDEASRWTTRLKIRLADAPMWADMGSVWAVAAALVLPGAPAALLVVCIFGYDWFRQYKPSGEAFSRKLFVACTVVLGVLAAHSLAARLTGDRSAALHAPHTASLVIVAACVVAMVVHTAINRGLVTLGIMSFGGRGRALLGPVDENLTEAAMLSLGALAGLAITRSLWLAPLAIVPMIALQRGMIVRHLEAAASTDGKTGLLNAVVWEQIAQREVLRAQRRGEALSLLLVDIDHFKRVNDGHGHLVGDAVLREVGAVLRTSLRGYDAIGRFGGEEFVAVLPGLGVDEARHAAERLRERIAALRVADLVEGGEARRSDPGPLAVTVSVGVATFVQGDDLELADLLRDADAALYRAKDHGRDRVCVAGDKVPPADLDPLPVTLA